MVTQRHAYPQTTWTGVGSFYGNQIDQALRFVLKHTRQLPFLPELPGRGPGSDMIGRTAGLLVDLPVEHMPDGWRLAQRAGKGSRRIAAYWQRDLEALAEFAGDFAGTFKFQVAGFFTLAACVRLSNGSPVLSDERAANDVVTSFAEGITRQVMAVQRRLPRAQLMLQIDEPSLPSICAGSMRSAVGGVTRLSSIEASVLQDRFSYVIHAASIPVVVHCCAANPPLGLIAQAGATAASFDLSLLDLSAPRVLNEAGTALEAGMGLWPGVVPALAPSNDVSVLSDVAASVERVRTLWRRVGRLGQLHRPSGPTVVTPACGMAGASLRYARLALRHCEEVATQLMVGADS